MNANLNQNKHNTPLWKGMIVQSSFPAELQDLNTIATNLWWTWNYEAKDLFREIDEELWDETKNPIQILKAISYDRLQELSKNENFMQQYKSVLQKLNDYMSITPEKNSARIGYFSMEYGLDDSLKIFSGGLGILAGDYLKEASDTNTNLVAVGFLYKYGYFQQKLSIDGDQIAVYNRQNPSELPIHLVTDDNNNPLTVQVGLPGRIINAQICLVHVGRVKLYLLDTDISDNNEEDRAISHALYGGNNEHRLKQEMLLGIGGVRTLEAVGETIDTYHCNEGHAAFINLERLRKLIKHKNFSFQKALEVVRSSTLYTTHTPVPAGHDSFPEDLMMTYLGQFPERLQLNWNEFMNLGRMHPDNQEENFSMSNLAISTSQEINGVSELHGDVSKDMFKDLWQGYSVEESHIGYVTNGVHYGTWTSKEWQELYKKTFGDDYLNNLSDKKYWGKIFEVENDVIWKLKKSHRKYLLDYIKENLHKNWTQRFEDPKKLIKITESINNNTLTIGFARRFATYKRAYLLFSNLERLSEIVNNPERPVQFIFAGKAHPNDKPGQNMIKEIVRISKLPEFFGKIIFIENYDMNLAKRLVQGVDIWLNTPTRPLEASGTSGMKAVMNGAMNFSVLDGWWCEGYTEGAGWALPEERTYENQELQNNLDAETIYNILENDIAPLYYDRDNLGIPHNWIQYMKKCIAEIAPKFTTKRMIDDYHSQFYSKLAQRFNKLTENNYALTDEITSWKQKISETWDNISVISVDIDKTGKEALTLGESYNGAVKLDLKGLSPEEIGVELIITEQMNPEHSEIQEINQFEYVKNEEHISVYSITIKPKHSGVFNYGIRMYPKHPALPHRQDFAFVRWI
ncbi:MAG: alpha-glucan family phosphorylase [Bacteroidales bacterium]|jgi:alpha-glucan phosphorylase-like protein|nr:alpha-glucan family phosphorylase [Bacteroidales bacterium]